jgi:hypothetical protein
MNSVFTIAAHLRVMDINNSVDFFSNGLSK